MRLKQGEAIVTAYAQSASGPGWSNTPVWVIVRGADHNLREVCLQPGEQSEAMRFIYAIAAEVNARMTMEANMVLRGKP